MRRWGLDDYLLSEAAAAGLFRAEPVTDPCGENPAWHTQQRPAPPAQRLVEPACTLSSETVDRVLSAVAGTPEVLAAWWVNQLNELIAVLGSDGPLPAINTPLARALADSVWEAIGPPLDRSFEATAREVMRAVGSGVNVREELVLAVLRWILRAAMRGDVPPGGMLERLLRDDQRPDVGLRRRSLAYPIADVGRLQLRGLAGGLQRATPAGRLMGVRRHGEGWAVYEQRALVGRLIAEFGRYTDAVSLLAALLPTRSLPLGRLRGVLLSSRRFPRG